MLTLKIFSQTCISAFAAQNSSRHACSCVACAFIPFSFNSCARVSLWDTRPPYEPCFKPPLSKSTTFKESAKNAPQKLQLFCAIKKGVWVSNSNPLLSRFALNLLASRNRDMLITLISQETTARQAHKIELIRTFLLEFSKTIVFWKDGKIVNDARFSALIVTDTRFSALNVQVDGTRGPPASLAIPWSTYQRKLCASRAHDEGGVLSEASKTPCSRVVLLSSAFFVRFHNLWRGMSFAWAGNCEVVCTHLVCCNVIFLHSLTYLLPLFRDIYSSRTCDVRDMRQGLAPFLYEYPALHMSSWNLPENWKCGQSWACRSSFRAYKFIRYNYQSGPRLSQTFISYCLVKICL